MQVCEILCESFGGIDKYVEGLTVKDWLHMTADEWNAFFLMADVNTLIDFVHFAHETEPKIVYHMFKNLPRDMLEDFENTPELQREFNKHEMKTIKRGIRDNSNHVESIHDLDEEFVKPKKGGRKGKHGKKHGKNGGKKHNKKGKKHTKKH